jgi:hypothetical protein
MSKQIILKKYQQFFKPETFRLLSLVFILIIPLSKATAQVRMINLEYFIP